MSLDFVEEGPMARAMLPDSEEEGEGEKKEGEVEMGGMEGEEGGGGVGAVAGGAEGLVL
jgi:hypothetical protein